VTPAESRSIADLDPTDEAVFAYLLTCALACIYDGGTMALARRWRRDPQTVASLRRRASQEAGETLRQANAARTTPSA
jgi:hypothetical protein